MNVARWLRLIAIISLFFIVAGGVVVVGAEAQPPVTPPNTPIDSEPDDTDVEDGRVVPSEQVPFGIRTTYGNDDLERPSGGSGVTVAVIDTGVDRTHPDLENRVTLCRDFTGSTVRQNSCTDREGHGTHVAGTVAADGGDDDLGIYGVAPESEIYAFKACDDDGRCSADPLAQALRSATDEGADVIVLSLGGRAEPRIQAATEYATDNGAVVVAASGNSGPDLDSIMYPAAHPNVIAVGAVGPRSGETVSPDNYRVPNFSSRGTDQPFSDEADGSLEIAALGVDVLSPIPGEDYGVKSGTSMATPHAAGLVAKIIAGSPSQPSVSELRAELRERAPRYDVIHGEAAREGYDPASGFGIPTVSEPRPALRVSPEVPTSDESFTLDGTASQSDAPITEYAWDTTNDGTFDRTGDRIALDKPPGIHRITLRVTDAESASGTVSEDVFVNDRPRLSVDAPDEVRPGENVTLAATVENEFGETTVSWDLPDGTTASGETVTTRFDVGESTVSATVTDEYEATSTERVVVTATPEPEDQGPVFSPVVAVAIVLLLLAGGLRRRR